MKRARDVRDQLEGLMERVEIELTSNPHDNIAIRKVVNRLLREMFFCLGPKQLYWPSHAQEKLPIDMGLDGHPPVFHICVVHCCICWIFYQPAVHEARGRLVLRLLCRFHVCISACLCVRTYHVINYNVT